MNGADMTNHQHLGPIDVTRRTGDEFLHAGGLPLDARLLDFWQWSCSDLVSNATRGILAEFLVAQALGIARGQVRDEWAPYDLTAQDGTRIEVKSAAYVQSWHQDRPSRISFNVRKTRAWSRQTNRQSDELRRQADVYIFALLAHPDQRTIDPLDVSQWEFYVVPTVLLDRRERSQHSITLPSLQKLAGAVGFAELGEAVREAGLRQRRERRAKGAESSPNIC